jgi:catalase
MLLIFFVADQRHGPSPDKMLQGRLLSYGDTQRYRLGFGATVRTTKA